MSRLCSRDLKLTSDFPHKYRIIVETDFCTRESD